MFVIFATKSLDDGSKGFRFNILGAKGLMRKRRIKSRGFKLFQRSKCMTAHHIGKYSLYVERSRSTVRKLAHFAG
jgi:hypothetical protein